MSSSKKRSPDWREFENLVARIEKDAGPAGLVVKSPDRVRCKTTGRLREVDATVRTRAGTSDILITIECRRRKHREDVTWVEQLATKKQLIGAARTLAVSSNGFSDGARTLAARLGIDLRTISDVSIADLNKLVVLDFVHLNHKSAAIARVGLKHFRDEQWTVPDPEKLDQFLPEETDAKRPIFRNTDTGHRWSLNDLWTQMQQAADPFAGIERNGKIAIRTACFSFPGNVTVGIPAGPQTLDDVLLSVALSIRVEQVWLDAATKIEYSSPDGLVLQRVEFKSHDPGAGDFGFALQLPKSATDTDQLRTRFMPPHGLRLRKTINTMAPMRLHVWVGRTKGDANVTRTFCGDG